MRVEFTVLGEPISQGSLRSLGAGRPTIASNRDRLDPWRQAVAAAAQKAMTFRGDDGTSGYLPPLTGPLELRATFVFARPKSHYRTGRHAGELKASAPAFCATRPDLDKLLRAIGDALTGIVWRDDAQVAAIVRAEKHYGAPCARIAVEELDGG